MLGVHHWSPRQPGQKGLRILSLDGGGTRGVLTIALLREVLKGFDKDVHEVGRTFVFFFCVCLCVGHVYLHDDCLSCRTAGTWPLDFLPLLGILIETPPRRSVRVFP